jgi:hypothetical protein
MEETKHGKDRVFSGNMNSLRDTENSSYRRSSYRSLTVYSYDMEVYWQVTFDHEYDSNTYYDLSQDMK